MNLVTPENAAQMEHNKWPRQYLIPQPQPRKEPELFSLKKIKFTLLCNLLVIITIRFRLTFATRYTHFFSLNEPSLSEIIKLKGNCKTEKSSSKLATP